jgi:predicted nucleic acid-binding protein
MSGPVGDVLAEHGDDLHAPHLVDVEVTQVLRRYVLRKWIQPERAYEAVRLLVEMPITRYPHGGLVLRAVELRRNLTACDAVYVALAESLEAPLVTRDAGIARSAGRLVEVVHVS